MEIGFVYSESCTNIERARDVFCGMRDAGADAVVICVYEQDLMRWKHDMIRLFEAARDAGLRRYVSYGRYGNVFSGLLMVPSLFAYANPHTMVQSEDGNANAGEAGSIHSNVNAGFWGRMCCVNHPQFQEYMHDQTQQILDRFEPEGLLFDEPKGLGLVCHCKHCQDARQDGQSVTDANLRSQVRFIESLSNQAKAHNKELLTMIVTGHHDDAVLERFASIESLDVLGTEAYWLNRGMTIEELAGWCPGAIEKLRSFGKRTQLWAQNFGLHEEHIEDLQQAYRIMAEAGPDQICSFWWWRENHDPERVMELTAQSLRLLKERTHALA